MWKVQDRKEVCCVERQARFYMPWYRLPVLVKKQHHVKTQSKIYTYLFGTEIEEQALYTHTSNL